MPASSGLIGLKDRAESLGGTIEIAGRPATARRSRRSRSTVTEQREEMKTTSYASRWPKTTSRCVEPREPARAVWVRGRRASRRRDGLLALVREHGRIS
jgi:hypothetical protein